MPRTAQATLPVILLLLGSLGLCAAGQRTGTTTPPLLISSMQGRDLFAFYCAPCHGRDGKGGGPTAPALKVAPPDLTALARRSGGTFPARRVEAFVTGDEPLPSRAHGSKDMPMWGPIFRELDPNDRRARIRVSNIVTYVRNLQTK